jgi:drug/metabolite transporter (DMT)-like permease
LNTAKNRALVGIGLAVLAVAGFAGLDTTTKWLSLGVPLMMAMFFRYLFQAVATTVAVFPSRGKALLHTRHPWLHGLRGLLLLGTSLFAFLSLKHMPVGEFTAIVMITPLVVTLLSARLLHEHVSGLRLLLVAGGFIGTLVIIRPGGQGFTWALLFPVGVVVINSAFQLLTSRMTRTEDSMTLQFYTGWVGTLVAALTLPWAWVELRDARLWLGLFLAGLLGTLGHYFLILSYKRAPASVLMPYIYVQIGFAMLGDWLLFAHVTDQWALTGMAMVAVCGVAGAWLTAHESRTTADPPEH